jgi:hypothetical protein
MQDVIQLGQRFGQFTVTRLVRDSLGYLADRVFVRCDCGREDVPPIKSLLKGTATSCNVCSRRTRYGHAVTRAGRAYNPRTGTPPEPVAVGKRFGCWTVTSFVGGGALPDRAWVRCDCGAQSLTRIFNLASGYTTRCHDCAKSEPSG